jgi:hypothetical protein
MRRLALLLMLCLAPGCTDLTGRSTTAPKSRQIVGTWSKMSLPFYGGKVIRADPDVLVVDYIDKGQTDRQGIARRFDQALRHHGWKHRESYGDLVTQMTRRHSYRTRKGGKVMLTVDKEGKRIRVMVRHMSKGKS